MEERKQIDVYLANPAVLYETWYQKKISKELEMDYGEFTGPMPPLDDINEKFTSWLKTHRQNLIQLICVEWDYPTKKAQYSNETDLIIAVSSIFGTLTDLKLEIACLLFLVGLDRLCKKA